jgi:hypothetical protein
MIQKSDCSDSIVAYKQLVGDFCNNIGPTDDMILDGNGHELADIQRAQRLPAMYSEAIFVKSGGLAFYGVDRIDLYRGAAGYIDRIRRGEKLSELPFLPRVDVSRTRPHQSDDHAPAQPRLPHGGRTSRAIRVEARCRLMLTSS